jgi:hypothetical protein
MITVKIKYSNTNPEETKIVFGRQKWQRFWV